MQAKVSKLKTGTKFNKKSSFSFLREVHQELKKVSWTTKKELLFSTKTVIGATFFLGIGIYLIDLFVRLTLEFIRFFAK